MFQISIFAYLLTIVISFCIGAIAFYFYKNKDLKAKQKKIACLNIEIENQKKEFTELSRAVEQNANIVIDQDKKIKKLKKIAKAVKDDAKNETIDDLLNYLDK